MASISASLSLTSPDVLTSPLAIAVDTVLSADSGGLIRATVRGTEPDVDDLVIYKADDKETQAFMYIRNMSTNATDYLHVRNETESDSALFAKIGGGQFAFVPVQADQTFAVHASVANTPIEYGIFGEDNTNVSFGGSGT